MRPDSACMNRFRRVIVTLPTYADHYVSRDQKPHYAFLKTFLKALTWLRGGKRWVLHQDWALSYLDADSFGNTEGGTGVGLGTDFLVRWHPDWQPGWIPYVDAGAGVQYAAGNAFPADASRWMITLHAGPGWLIPMKRDREAVISLRYLHMSNAGLVDNNSGYDVVHLVLGLRWGKGGN